MNETVTTVVGNVITEIRHRRVKDGTEVSSFRVASNERRFDRAESRWVDGDKLYVSVTCWRRLANNVFTSLSKGDPVVVTGRLYTREFEQNGQRSSVTELHAQAVGPDLSRCSTSVFRPQRDGAASQVGSGPEAVVIPGPGAAPDNRPADVADQPSAVEHLADDDSQRPALAVVGGSAS